MKNLLFSLVLLSATVSVASAQSFRSIDKSPMDVAYLPDNFAHDRSGDDKAVAKVYYSRPQKKGREVFGNVVAYDKVWRTGANEAAELKAYQDITIGGEKLAAGTYSLFTIPGAKEWTIIVSTDLDYWGTAGYQEKYEVLRVKVPSSKLSKEVEAFSIQFEDLDGKSAVMRLAWDKTVVAVPVKY
ncbi:Protein of unknown function [Reichenbachiella agariperforans]|uniref:DUF2911 domain-containing protein n=1 Tax=Reichenbachiella agariperforans TaxID=156994 RepID=A0A1M6JQB5_REIAG|nr:DUF2911 domain-containing protein [Reichenbachiella agariperforans]SHJ48773.1 Protein of unknown function [Reichenbachiella agariperforans]